MLLETSLPGASCAPSFKCDNVEKMVGASGRAKSEPLRNPASFL